MKRLFFAILLAFMSANAERLSSEQWNDLFRLCFNSDENACQRLIDNGLPNLKACDKSDCNTIGIIYENTGAFKEAASFYQKACELNDKFACSNLGTLYYYGRGVEENLALSNKAYEKSCELGYSAGCYYLGFHYENAEKANLSSAKKYYDKACRLNHAESCARIGVLYYYGKGVKQDFFEAFKAVQKSCESKDSAQGCYLLGVLYDEGKGTKQSRASAKKYFSKACSMRSQKGCDAYKKLNEEGVKQHPFDFDFSF